MLKIKKSLTDAMAPLMELLSQESLLDDELGAEE